MDRVATVADFMRCTRLAYHIHNVGIPYACLTAILQLLADNIAMYDIISQRSITFTRSCLQSDSD